MKLGWIGTGVMGSPMAGHLQAAGHELYVLNRTRAKSQALLDAGAIWCDSPAAVAAEAEIVFTMVGFPVDVESTYLGEAGVLSARGGCRIVVDMTTSRPSLAASIAADAAGKGVASLDAPVSGGDIGARNAALAIMVGGDEAAYDEVMPLFRLMGKTIALMGGPGAGQHTKMCNQILVAGNMIGACESILYAERLGLDAGAVIEIVGKGAAASWAINNLGPRIVDGNFDPGFYVEHFIKDMEIALEEAAAAGVELPGLSLVRQLYTDLKDQGGGRLGTQALMQVLRRMNGGD